MENTAVQLFNKVGLAKKGEYNYSEIANAFLSLGFTSNAGNTYFNSVRLLEGIFIKEDIGFGHTHQFLNGIRIYSTKDNILIAQRSYHCKFYNKMSLVYEVKDMLKEILNEAAQKEDITINMNEVQSHIDRIVMIAFNEDQRIMLQNSNLKHLSA